MKWNEHNFSDINFEMKRGEFSDHYHINDNFLIYYNYTPQQVIKCLNDKTWIEVKSKRKCFLRDFQVGVFVSSEEILFYDWFLAIIDLIPDTEVLELSDNTRIPIKPYKKPHKKLINGKSS